MLYTADLQAVIELHGLSPHFYADDSQICGFCRPGDVGTLSQRLVDCFDDVALWMRSNRLQLNVHKTDLLWCSTSRRQSQLPTGPLIFGGYDVTPSQSVRNLGVFFVADLSMRSNINVIVSRCFAALRQLRSIRRYISVPVCQSLVTSLVLSLTRLDYCNRVAFGLPALHLCRLQSVQNAAARIIFDLRRTAHISCALMCLHWLRVDERVRFKIAVLVYKSLHGWALSYFTNIFHAA